MSLIFIHWWSSTFIMQICRANTKTFPSRWRKFWLSDTRCDVTSSQRWWNPWGNLVHCICTSLPSCCKDMQQFLTAQQAEAQTAQPIFKILPTPLILSDLHLTWAAGTKSRWKLNHLVQQASLIIRDSKSANHLSVTITMRKLRVAWAEGNIGDTVVSEG